jgi:hypothetical protein
MYRHAQCGEISDRSLTRGFRPVPQFSSLADVEAALGAGRLTRDYQLLLSEKMARDENADRVLSLLEKHGVAFTVSPHHHGDAVASRAERRPA